MAPQPLQPDSSEEPIRLPIRPAEERPVQQVESSNGPASEAPATIPVSDEVLAQQNSPVRSLLGLIDHDIRVIAVLSVTAAVVLLGQYAYLTLRDRQPVSITRKSATSIEYRLDLNAAHWMELAQLEGIGEVLARRIAEHREQNGLFQSVNELTLIKGIGPAKLSAVEPYLKVTVPRTSSNSDQSSPNQPHPDRP